MFFLRWARSVPSPNRTISWLRKQERTKGGIAPYPRSREGDPSVAGALLPTLLQIGEREIATRVANALLSIQKKDGGFPSLHGSGSNFASGQALKGLLAINGLVPGASQAIERASTFLYHRIRERNVDELDLSTLEAFKSSASVMGNASFIEAGEQCLEEYIAKKRRSMASPPHFAVQELGALIDLGQADILNPLINKLIGKQISDRSMPREEKTFSTPSRLAELALCLYRMGHWQQADDVLAWLEKHQKSSGGFPESTGLKALNPFCRELAWTAKFYLEAHRLRVRSFMDRHVVLSWVAGDDGRVQALLSVIKPGDKVVEVGCGTGRFLKAVGEKIPTLELTGVDISTHLLSQLPPHVVRFEGSLECTPSKDNNFDVVFSVEAMEHSPNWKAAIIELFRIVRPGGWVVIIDKQLSQWGRFDCPSWEDWPDANQIRDLMSSYCDKTSCQAVSYDGHPADGLMLAWFGRKKQ